VASRAKIRYKVPPDKSTRSSNDHQI